MRRRDFLKAILTGTAAAALGVAPRQMGDSPEATRRNGPPTWRFTDEQIAAVAEAWLMSQPAGIIIKPVQAHSTTVTNALLKAHQFWV
jgi:hypothetical protein